MITLQASIHYYRTIRMEKVSLVKASHMINYYYLRKKVFTVYIHVYIISAC